MKKIGVLSLLVLMTALFAASFKYKNDREAYSVDYFGRLDAFNQQQSVLLRVIEKADLYSEEGIASIKNEIGKTRVHLKSMDFWFRYLEPIAYKMINGPLPVEWETEVFEKFENPYKREGAGLTLAEIYLDEEKKTKDSLLNLIRMSVRSAETYAADSITANLKTHHHFYLCNRLFLLNLAAIYTTGFECPDTSRIVPELRSMMNDVNDIYRSFNESFPEMRLPDSFLVLYQQALSFVNKQTTDYSQFDHFRFIRDYVNPLYILNQDAINKYRVVTKSFVDYSLNKRNKSIFNKQLYNGQNPKGLFLRIDDEQALAEISRVGKLLFYDPILSGNNKRSCASCHKPTEYFTDTAVATSMNYDGKTRLPRNSPSLINANFNHLVMLDGNHISLQNQTRAVITSPAELACSEKEVIEKVLSCPDYQKAFRKLVALTPEEPEITFGHITSTITYYYSRFSEYYAPFDEAMNNRKDLPENVRMGFNVFMSKAQCATCHFVPQFNGVKPPFVSSEFEVLGVPEDTSFKQLSDDKGRYNVNPAKETLRAFRTGSLRNSAHTAPYMHNGVFKTMNEVIDFYDAGGGAGKGLEVANQTLSSDSLHLSKTEKENLTQFINSLDERVRFEEPPGSLPRSKNKLLNARKVGGEY
jgi:cytochrome c peroxidase